MHMKYLLSPCESVFFLERHFHTVLRVELRVPTSMCQNKSILFYQIWFAHVTFISPYQSISFHLYTMLIKMETVQLNNGTAISLCDKSDKWY